MGNYRHLLVLGLQALLRNRLQTALAMLGVTVGVGALLTSVALGRGAQEAIREQLLAAGVNMIVVTAGNYQSERPQASEPTADHGALDLERNRKRDRLIALLEAELRRRQHSIATEAAPALSMAGLRSALWRPGATLGLRLAHFEDDPMAVHDHPTAKERLGDAMAGLGAAATLTLDDARAILERIPGVQFVAGGVHENARLSRTDAAGRQWFTRLHGTAADLPRIRPGWSYPRGRFFSTREVEGAEQVMVLGQVAVERLFGADVDPVGETVLLWNQPFRIVGVVGSSSWALPPAPGDDQFDAVYVPVTTVHRLLNLSKLNTITVTTLNAGDTTRVAGDITDLLRQRHGISDTMPDDFSVRSQAQQVLGKGLPPDLARVVGGNLSSVDELTVEQLSSSLQRANRTMLSLLAGVAAVSLLVGGIGVTNLLLLSVTQRSREVGLRMALGARRRDITLQFLTEALLLALLGGLLGALLSLAAATFLEQTLQWTLALSPLSTLLAIAVAALLGVLSGVYPARRAGRLDPIKALHFE